VTHAVIDLLTPLCFALRWSDDVQTMILSSSPSSIDAITHHIKQDLIPVRKDLFTTLGEYILINREHNIPHYE
jgi:hypothetical protein